VFWETAGIVDGVKTALLLIQMKLVKENDGKRWTEPYHVTSQR